MEDIPKTTLKAAIKWLYMESPKALAHAIQTTATDPHTSGGMGTEIAAELRRLTDTKDAADAIPKDAVIAALRNVLDEMQQTPNAQKLARLFMERMNQEFALGLDTSQLPASPLTIEQKRFFEKVEAFENVSSPVRTRYAIDDESNPAPLSRQDAAALALSAGEYVLSRVREASLGAHYAMSKEEQETLTHEITEFVAAHTDTYKSSSSPYKEIARFKHYDPDGLRDGYARMIGCGGSDPYQHAVHTFFSRLLDAAIAEEKKKSPVRER